MQSGYPTVCGRSKGCVVCCAAMAAVVPRALSEAMLATAMEVARTESMTLGQIAKRIEAVHGEPMPCAL